MLAYPLDPDDLDAATALPDDPRAVAAFNRFLREQFPDDWPPTYFAVGNGPAGDPYFLDLDDPTAVQVWDHETHEVIPAVPGFAAWVERLREGEFD